MKKFLTLVFACMLWLQAFSQFPYLYPNDELILMFTPDATDNDIQSILNDLNMHVVDGPTTNFGALLVKYDTPPIIPPNGNPWGPITGDKKKAANNSKVTSAGFNFDLAVNESSNSNSADQDVGACYDILDPITQPNGGHPVLTAIFDTGISGSIASSTNFFNITDLGHNYIVPNTLPFDDHDHGSHIASIVMNNLENNNSEIQLKAYKTHNASGQGQIWHAIKALDQAVSDQVQVVNMSFSYYIDSDHSAELKVPFRMAIRKAKELAGILCIAAAGNINNDNDYSNLLNGKAAYPASFDEPNIISVASATCQMQKSVFSNYGQVSVDIFAPGEDIWGEDQFGNPIQMSGTSQATAFVSKLATFLGTYQQQFDWETTKCAILNGTVPATDVGYTLTDGYINSANSLAILLGNQDCIDYGQYRRSSNEKDTETLEIEIDHSQNSPFFRITSNKEFSGEALITNINGQVLYRKSMDIQPGIFEYSIDFNPTTKGVYFFSLKEENKIFTLKFIQ